ncbi:uncharacterized protein [Periplaneta americana]|uniref:uncharacterized protein isoform X1 n=1 Tax=Periplaneta americana TaxID=6978 RepID=UPI0037E856EF
MRMVTFHVVNNAVIHSLADMKKMVQKAIPRMDPVLLGLMSLITIILSTVALEVGTRVETTGRTSTLHCVPTGQCKWVSQNPQKKLGLRVKLNSSDAIAGILASGLLTIGDVKKNPYFFLPWLVLTLKGFISCEGPALLGLGYIIIPIDGFPAIVFFFACTFLFVEEICLWSEVLNICRWSWALYKKRLVWQKMKSEVDERQEGLLEMLNRVQNRDYIDKSREIPSS